MLKVKNIFILPFMILSFVTYSLKVYAVEERYFEYEDQNEKVVITWTPTKRIEQIPNYLGSKKVVRFELYNEYKDI